MANYTLIPPEIMDHSQGCFMRKGEGGHGGGDTGGMRGAPALAAASLPPCTLCPAGVVGDWRDHFSPLQNALFNRIYQEEMGGLELPMHWPMA